MDEKEQYEKYLSALELGAVVCAMEKRVPKTIKQIADLANVDMAAVRELIVGGIGNGIIRPHQGTGPQRYKLTQRGEVDKAKFLRRGNLLDPEFRRKQAEMALAEAVKAGETDPVDRLGPQVSQERAAWLLLNSETVISTGIVRLSGVNEHGDEIKGQVAGYVELDPKGALGQTIIERGDAPRSTDNFSRWTLIDHGKVAKIILELDEPGIGEWIIGFEYPVHRDALIAIAESQWICFAVPHEGENKLMAVTISTEGQVKGMLNIMDERQPKRPPSPEKTYAELTNEVTTHEIDPANAPNALGAAPRPYDDDELKKAIAESPRPLAAATSLFDSLALHSILDPEQPQTTIEIAHKLDMDQSRVNYLLHKVIQGDLPWAWGRKRPDGSWEWVKDTTAGNAPLPRHFEGQDLFTKRGRKEAAKKLLDEMGVEIPIEEISPALAMMQGITDYMGWEQAVSGLLHTKPPIWTTAKGFAAAYEECRNRARIAKQLGPERSDELTNLAVHLGSSLKIAHVLVMDKTQLLALPELDKEEATAFLKQTPLPFDPFFIDFTGESELPQEPSTAAKEGYVRLVGAVVNSEPHDPKGALFITPVFVYSSTQRENETTMLGTFCLNRTDDPTYQFNYVMARKVRFQMEDPGLIILASSPILAKHPELAEEYQRLVNRAGRRIISVLHFLAYSNVETIEKPLERRERKRTEKRGWNIPLVVRISRPSKRSARSPEGEEPVNWTHQWEVIGHPKHFQKGPIAWCIVCQGKETEGLPCPRCQGTGLDPDKVTECWRIDVKTGEKTCPNGCRKIWCPPHWKGPEDKVAVPKTRKLK